jgi:hypothetical protein
MKNRILYIFLLVFIGIGAVYSYRQLDFGRKTTIFFKIAFGDENTMMRMPPKKPPAGEMGGFTPPNGRHEDSSIEGERGGYGPPRAKGINGKPGMGKIISLRNVIPYTFILAFFILIARILDLVIRKIKRAVSST